MNWQQLMDRALEVLRKDGAAAAEPLLLKALDTAGERSEYRALTHFNLGLVRYDLKRIREAEAHFAEAIEQIQDQLPELNELYSTFLKTIIEFYEKEGRSAESKPYLFLEIEQSKQTLGSLHPYVINTVCELSEVLIKIGEYSEAEKQLSLTLETIKSARGPDHPQNASVHLSLSKCCAALGRPQEAQYHRTRAESLQGKLQKQEERQTIENTDLRTTTEQTIEEI